jgi:hypothetical protein
LNQELTPEIVASLVGGQMEIEITRRGESILCCGELKELTLNTNTLGFKFAWMAEKTAEDPEEWQNRAVLDGAVNLNFYTVTNIGPSLVGGDCWQLQFVFGRHQAVIYPPDGWKLDPLKISGRVNCPA